MGIFGEVTTSMRMVPTRRQQKVILELSMKRMAPGVKTAWPRSRISRGTLAETLALIDLALTLIGRPFFIPVLPVCRTFPVDTTSYL